MSNIEESEDMIGFIDPFRDAERSEVRAWGEITREDLDDESDDPVAALNNFHGLGGDRTTYVLGRLPTISELFEHGKFKRPGV